MISFYECILSNAGRDGHRLRSEVLKRSSLRGPMADHHRPVLLRPHDVHKPIVGRRGAKHRLRENLGDVHGETGGLSLQRQRALRGHHPVSNRLKAIVAEAPLSRRRPLLLADLRAAEHADLPANRLLADRDAVEQRGRVWSGLMLEIFIIIVFPYGVLLA